MGWDLCRPFHVRVDGSDLSINSASDELNYCEDAVSLEGMRRAFDSGDRYGTDSIALLSTWEHQTLAKTLKAL